MLEYDGDLKIPTHYLVQPPVIKNTLTELLCKHGLSEYAVSETQKYGHVTYFWNGNRSGKVDEKLETYEEIPSDVIPFEQEPAMKSREITDHMIAAMESKKYDFLRCNFPNGDMVGHTGVISAVITAMECVDESVGRIIEAADRLGYLVLVTADHGNADQMTETKKGKTSIRTAHSLNLLTEQIDIVKPLGWERTSTTLTDMDMNYLLLYLEEKPKAESNTEEETEAKE